MLITHFVRKKPFCSKHALPLIERLPYMYLMSLDISIPLSDLFIFKEDYFCGAKKVFLSVFIVHVYSFVWIYYIVKM